MYWGCSHYCGDVRFTISPQQLLSVLSTAVGCFCGFVLKWCHCTAPRHSGGGLVKVKPVICDVTAVRRHPGSHARTHNQTNQTLCNHKTMTWHLSQRNPPLEKRGRSSDGSGSEKKWVEIERERSKISNSSVCLCASVIGWEEHQKKKAGELQAVRAEGIDWLVILKPYLLHQPYKQMHMSVSWSPSFLFHM